MRIPVVLITVVALGSTAGAATAKAPATGTYHAGGGITFKFKLHKGKCPLPPKNLTNPKAKRGKVGKGICFSSFDDPPVNMNCPQGSLTGEQAVVSAMSGLRLTKSGSLHVKAYTYTSAPDPVGFTELSLKVTGSRVRGFVRQVDSIYPNGAPVRCDSGKLSFTAHK